MTKPEPGQVLTWRQGKVLRFIEDYHDTHGFAPSMREIGDAAGLASMSSVTWVVNRLVEKGYLHRLGKSPRAIAVVRAGDGPG